MATLFATGYFSLNLAFEQRPINIVQENTESIVTGTINVNAGAYEYAQFQVPPDVSTPIVRGSFFVNAGSFKDIHVMILDEADFDSWQAGGTPNDPYYFSGNVIAADIEAKVPKGSTLYLVFDNIYSPALEKSIEAEIG